jgi:hypothetical protein
MFLLNVKKGGKFIKETIDSKFTIPQFIQSMQTQNGRIYIVGGVLNGEILK